MAEETPELLQINMCICDLPALGFALAVVGSYALASCFLQYLRECQLRKQRPNGTQEAFLTHFRGTAVSQDLCKSVYKHLPRFQMIVRDFPVQPGDNLERVYHIGGVHGIPLVEVVEDLALACGLTVPERVRLLDIINELSPIITVEDLTKLLNRLRTTPSPNGES